jgi:hypothetical protein
MSREEEVISRSRYPGAFQDPEFPYEWVGDGGEESDQ